MKSKHKIIAVAQIAEFKAPYGSNFIASLCSLSNACKKNNIKQILILSEEAAQREWCKKLIKDEFIIYFLPLNKNIIDTALLLNKIIVKEDIDILHTHFSYFDIIAFVAAVLSLLHFKRVVVIWHRHSDFPIKQNLSRKFKDFIKHRLLGSFSYTIAVSTHLYKKVLQAGFPLKRLITINNGIEISRAVSFTRSTKDVLSEINVLDKNIFILMFGWTPLVKGVDVAIDAIGKIIQQRNDIVLGIVGREALQEYISKYFMGPPPEWVKILPPVEQPADYYQCAKTFLSASRNEGFSYSLVEAMFNKCSVIMSDIPGVAWAHDLPFGIFFKSERADDLAQKLLENIETDEAERQNQLLSNYNYVRNKYGIDKWCADVIGFYNNCYYGTKQKSFNK